MNTTVKRQWRTPMPLSSIPHFAEGLNMLVGGPWRDRAAYLILIAEHISAIRHIDPHQWRGWPRISYTPHGYSYAGIYPMHGAEETT